ncbi:hypothetical protein B0H10DRAFT_1960235 [Mycena sp. CBHHK59/15]|nr:hypothetical protein B0H10DRAFT_1960235 [Mycena sp. CBHHK59/15]
MASRALSQKSKRDERASSEGRWCSFAVTVRAMRTATKSGRMLQLAPESGSERRMKTFARGEGKPKMSIEGTQLTYWVQRALHEHNTTHRSPVKYRQSQRREFSKITKDGDVVCEGLMRGRDEEERFSGSVTGGLNNVGMSRNPPFPKRGMVTLVRDVPAKMTVRGTGRAMDSGCNTEMQGKGAATGQLVMSIMNRDTHCHRRNAVFAYVREDGQSASMEE